MKTKTLSLVLIPVLAYFWASPRSEAVTPPPDGGYPGGNTAEGENALLNLTSGTYMGCVVSMDSEGRDIFVIDAQRDGKRFIVRAIINANHGIM